MNGRTDIRYPSHPRKPYYWPGGVGGGGGLEKRRVVRHTTPIFGVEGIIHGTIDMPDTAGAMLLSVRSTHKGWLRLYATEADRTLDNTRLVDDPMPSTGIILDVVFERPDDLEFLLFNGDEWGTPAFNGDDPATAKLYYRIEAPPTDLAMIYARSGFAGGDYDTGDEPPWEENGVLVKYVTAPGAGRSRYYEEFGQLRAYGGGSTGSDGTAQFTITPVSAANVTAEIVVWKSNTMDTNSFCYFSAFLSRAAGWSGSTNIRGGIVRISADLAAASIDYTDPTGLSTTLAVGTNVTFAADDQIFMEVITSAFDVGLVTEGVEMTVKFDGVVQCTAVVPPALVARPNHNGVGIVLFDQDPPSAPLAFGGFAILSIVVSGANPRVTIDLGYVPIEIPGGSIRVIENLETLPDV